MTPKNARKGKADLPKVEPPDDVRDYIDKGEPPLDVDVDGHLRWLETGEGEPWPRERRD